MDGVNVFTRLRRLAIKVENESRIFDEKMQIPSKQRTVCGNTTDNILKEMQFDAHKLKNEAKKELERQQQLTSFKEVLAACENLLHVNQKQASSLKEYLVQYGYQTATQPTKPVANLAKQTGNQTGEDKENEKIETCHPENECATSDQPKEPTGEPKTPEKGETNTSNNRESVTPKMEDFGLSMNRVNLFLKKGVPSSSQPKALDDFNSDRMTPIEPTVVCPNADLKSLEDSELISGDEGPHHPWVKSTILPEKSPLKNYLTEGATVSQTGTPESPNITSWFLKEPSKPPVAPPVTFYQEETFTPPTPDCQTTQLVYTVPQEPRRLVDTIEMAEPREPHQYSTDVVNTTPEIPACVANSSYTKQQSGMFTPPQIKKGPPHMSFLQQDATPKTPELTMSFSQLCKQPSLKATFQHNPTASHQQESFSYVQPTVVPKTHISSQTPPGQLCEPPSLRASFQHNPTASHQQESFSYVQPTVVPKTHMSSQSPPGFRILAPITQEEFHTLSSKIRQNLSLEKVNEWMQILDDHIARKPKEEKFLSQEDLDILQVYPWLRAALMLLSGGFSRLEKMEVPGFDDPIYVPL